jgi:hypothetical protein
MSILAPFHHAQFGPVTPKSRSIPTRFVFAEVRGFEMGEGLMDEIELAGIAACRVCDSIGMLERCARRRAPLTNIGRPPHSPWRMVKEAEASVPSPARSPGRRGRVGGFLLAAAPTFCRAQAACEASRRRTPQTCVASGDGAGAAGAGGVGGGENLCHGPLFATASLRSSSICSRPTLEGSPAKVR